MRDFRTLRVWHKSHQLVLDVYRVTSDFPKSEVYGLMSQLRRSSASVPANIAGGCGRASDAELAHFLQVAMGSASETEYHLLLAHDLGFLGDADHERLTASVVEVKRMLTAFLQTLREEEQEGERDS